MRMLRAMIPPMYHHRLFRWSRDGPYGVAVDGMGHFMGQDGRKLRFVLHTGDQSRVDVDLPVGISEGVQGRVLNDLELEGQALRNPLRIAG